MHTEETDTLGMEVRVCRRQRASRSKAQTEKQEKCVLFPLCSIKWDFVCFRINRITSKILATSQVLNEWPTWSQIFFWLLVRACFWSPLMKQSPLSQLLFTGSKDSEVGPKKASDLWKPSFGKLQITISRLFRILAPPRKLPLVLLLVDSHPAPALDLLGETITQHSPAQPFPSFLCHYQVLWKHTLCVQ